MRVLCVVDFYPHATESYIETEIRAAVALGVEVHVWSTDTNSRFPHPVSVPLHAQQSLADCIAAVRPALVHAYFLNFGQQVLEDMRASGVPFTIRAHGFEYQIELLDRLAADPAVRRIVVFPHMAGDADPAHRHKIAVLPTMFNPALYRAGAPKDRRLVVRVASAVRTKNMEYFMRAAALCPGHRFVLALGQGYDFNFAAAKDFKAFNASLGSPVEIRENLDWPAVSRLLGEAAIYMYTPPIHRPGMPISIAEAMASGCLVVAPEIEGMRDYLGASGGALYRTVEEAAAIVRASADWRDAAWRKVAARAAAFAARRHSSRVLAPKLVEIWRQAVGGAPASAPFAFKTLWRRIAGRARA